MLWTSPGLQVGISWVTGSTLMEPEFPNSLIDIGYDPYYSRYRQFIMWEFYRNRGPSVVRLNRRRGGEEGIYRCVIPDMAGVNQNHIHWSVW